MAFVTVVSGTTIVGNMRLTWGTFTNGTDDEGGDITTTLDYIHSAIVNITSHVDAAQPKVFLNQTNAAVATNGTLGLLIAEGVDGTWLVFGK